MVNILDHWPEDGELLAFPQTQRGWVALLQLRKETFQGFVTIEERTGFLQSNMPLSSPKGQDALRLLFFRCLEELVEGLEAQDPMHVKEEVIDAFNYFLGIPLLDSSISLDAIATEISKECWPPAHPTYTFGELVPLEDIPLRLLQESWRLLDTLRNRAWQNRAQSVYFDGYPALLPFIGKGTALFLSVFLDWTEFVRFYIAKDRVLQFRLRSNY